MKKKFVAVICFLIVGLVLASCSTTRKGAPVTDANGNVIASGIGTDGGYGAGYGGTNAACLQAPANQSFYFDLNSDNVRQQDNPCLAAQAKYLIAHPNARVRLEGNCDNRGSREYNRGLGWRRANAVRSILLQDGVSPSQVTTFSWGSEKASMGTGEAVWQDLPNEYVFEKYDSSTSGLMEYYRTINNITMTEETALISGSREQVAG